MLKLCRVTKVKVLFLVLEYVFNFNLFEFSAAILEKSLFVFSISQSIRCNVVSKHKSIEWLEFMLNIIDLQSNPWFYMGVITAFQLQYPVIEYDSELATYHPLKPVPLPFSFYRLVYIYFPVKLV